MSKITVVDHVTLDGVMQSPGSPEEDPRGGFDRGGWAVPYSDEVMGRVMGEGMSIAGVALLLGRFTYEAFAAYWPQQTDNPISDALNKRTKYVASTTLDEPLPWENSVLLAGEATDAVAELKAESDDDLVILGSGVLVRSLMKHDLIDEFLLTIHPLVLGIGTKLFADGVEATLELVDCIPTTTGVLIATYRLAT